MAIPLINLAECRLIRVVRALPCGVVGMAMNTPCTIFEWPASVTDGEAIIWKYRLPKCCNDLLDEIISELCLGHTLLSGCHSQPILKVERLE